MKCVFMMVLVAACGNLTELRQDISYKKTGCPKERITITEEGSDSWVAVCKMKKGDQRFICSVENQTSDDGFSGRTICKKMMK